MRGTTSLRKITDRLETRALGGPAMIALAYGYLFWMTMVFAFCSMRFPVDPSAVEPPFRPYCGPLTWVNLALAVLLALDCVLTLRAKQERRFLRLLSPLLGLASIACVQLVVEILRDLRVG